MEMYSADATQLNGESVLVTGATGFTGRHLVRRLVAAGVKVRAIARTGSKIDPLADLPIEWFRGEVFDPGIVHSAMQGVRYVFHMATLYRTGSATEAAHHDVHVTSTKLLAREAVCQPDFCRFVHVSTVGVHGHVESPPADEQAPIRPGDEYQRTKAEAEHWLAGFAAEKGLSYTIIRPAAIYGPEDDRLLKVFRMAIYPICPVLGRRPCTYHLIHVEDLVQLLLCAAVHPQAAGEVFIAGNPFPIRLDEMIRIIGRTLGRNPSIVHLPVAPFWWLAIVCETICSRFGIEPPLYRRRIKFFLNDRAFDTRKARERLDFKCSNSHEKGLAETAHWYRRHGLL